MPRKSNIFIFYPGILAYKRWRKEGKKIIPKNFTNILQQKMTILTQILTVFLSMLLLFLGEMALGAEKPKKVDSLLAQFVNPENVVKQEETEQGGVQLKTLNNSMWERTADDVVAHLDQQGKLTKKVKARSLLATASGEPKKVDSLLANAPSERRQKKVVSLLANAPSEGKPKKVDSLLANQSEGMKPKKVNSLLAKYVNPEDVVKQEETQEGGIQLTTKNNSIWEATPQKVVAHLNRQGKLTKEKVSSILPSNIPRSPSLAKSIISENAAGNTSSSNTQYLKVDKKLWTENEVSRKGITASRHPLSNATEYLQLARNDDGEIIGRPDRHYESSSDDNHHYLRLPAPSDGNGGRQGHHATQMMVPYGQSSSPSAIGPFSSAGGRNNSLGKMVIVSQQEPSLLESLFGARTQTDVTMVDLDSGTMTHRRMN